MALGTGSVAALPRRAPLARPAMAELGWLSGLPVVVLAAVVLLSVAAPGVATAAALAGALVGGVVGLPHGAVDHLVPWWWSGRRPTAPGLLLGVIGYAAAAVLAGAALVRWPDAALAGLLALSAWHFGRAEVVAWAERAGRDLPTADGLLAAVAHGAVVVGGLLWRAGGSGPWAQVAPGLAAFARSTRVAGTVALVVLVLAALARLLRGARRREAGELALVAAAFLLAQPWLAFGAYFGAWHSLRHSGRLLDLARRPGGEALLGWPAAAARLARAAALPTGVALVALGLLLAAAPVLGLQAEVELLLALTVPHALTVAWLDRAVRAA